NGEATIGLENHAAGGKLGQDVLSVDDWDTQGVRHLFEREAGLATQGMPRQNLLHPLAGRIAKRSDDLVGDGLPANYGLNGVCLAGMDESDGEAGPALSLRDDVSD